MSDPKSRVMTADCPECNTMIRFHALPKVGSNLTCEECSELLEVRSISPLELDWAYEDDDFDYDEEWEEIDGDDVEDDDWDDEEDDKWD